MRIYIVFLFILSILHNEVFAMKEKNQDWAIGFIGTKHPVNPKEEGAYTRSALKSLKKVFPDRKIIYIDYNSPEILNNNEIGKLAISMFDHDSSFKSLSSSDVVRHVKMNVVEFMKKNKIRYIIGPGDYYNYSVAPFHKTNNREIVTAAVSKILLKNQAYGIMICGSMQGLVYTQGVELAPVSSMIGKNNAKLHVSADPDPAADGVRLTSVSLNKDSYLAGLLKDDLKERDEKNNIKIGFPSAHTQAINVSTTNLKKLTSLGMKISGMSKDGMVMAIEYKHPSSKNPNLFAFQDHPEALLHYGCGDVLESKIKRGLIQKNTIAYARASCKFFHHVLNLPVDDLNVLVG